MWPLFKVVNLIYLLVSSYAWFGFLLPLSLVPVAVSAFMIFCFMFGKFKYSLTSRAYAIFGMIFIYFLYSLITVDLSLALLNLMSYLPAGIIFMLDKEYQKDLLTSVSKWFCIILAVSLGYYGLSLVVSLPNVPFNVPNNDFYETFSNYFFFIKSGNPNEIRFNSIFLEPGHMSMICCIMLFANKYRMKEQPWLWSAVICVVISLSLVGYVVLLVSLVLLKIRSIGNAIGLAILVGGAWLFVTMIWNGGNNPANKLIVERLQYDESKGIKGNNRTVKQTDYFFRHCIADGTIITGIGSQKDYGSKIKGAGYKIFMLKYGVIATIIVAILYLMFIPPTANKRFAFSFFAVICMLFLQRAYPSWYAWLMPYILGIGATRGQSFFTPEQHMRWNAKKRKRSNKNQSLISA